MATQADVNTLSEQASDFEHKVQAELRTPPQPSRPSLYNFVNPRYPGFAHGSGDLIHVQTKETCTLHKTRRRKGATAEDCRLSQRVCGRDCDTMPQNATPACWDHSFLLSATGPFDLDSRLFQVMNRLESELLTSWLRRVGPVSRKQIFLGQRILDTKT